MANAEHLALLKDGVEVWNAWRLDHSGDKPDLSGADLSRADLSRANLSRSNLRQANLRRTDLPEADLSEADLGMADLSRAYLIMTNLSWADLTEANLREANLGWANLSKANLSQANFLEANLGRANLSRANFLEANLSWANLSRANLSRSNLREADLSRANLSRADLSWSEITKATIGWTVFVENDLSNVRGLETLHHLGPSGIGIDTIYKSGGKIPEVFLRGAGIPDNFITYIASLIGKPFEFYSCFISYSTADQTFADRLYADLRAQGVRSWFAPHHIAGGKKIHEQIDEAIRLHDRLLLILSPASMQSEWVKTEIAKARRHEIKEGKRVLFPISIVPYETIRDWENFDADTGKDSAREIREYFIPDFSRWKDHDSYRKAFDRLLKDLKAETAKS